LTLRNSQGKYADSEKISTRLLARVDAGVDGLEEIDRVKLLVARANTLHLLGRGAEAYTLSARAIPLIPATPDGERLRVSAYSQMGQILQNLGRMDEAESYLKQTLELDAELGLDPLRVSRDENNLAGLLAVRGRFRESLALHRQAIPRLVATLGKDVPEYALRMNNLGMTEYGAGHLADAIAHVGEAAELAQARYGDQNQVVLSVRSNYALVLAAAGEFERADALANAALAALQTLFPAGSLAVIRAERTAGIVAFEGAQLDSAQTHFQACVDGVAAAKLEANPILARCRVGLADIALAQDRLDDAHALIEPSIAQQTLSLDPRHPDNAAAALALADWQIRSGAATAAPTTLQAIHPEALNEPWQIAYRDALTAAAKGDCAAFRNHRETLLGRYPAEHPRWRGLCP
jgi:tetratricopeptide (TPR) repeat protein